MTTRPRIDLNTEASKPTTSTTTRPRTPAQPTRHLKLKLCIIAALATMVGVRLWM